MTRTLNRLFLDHPRSVGEGYVEHLRNAVGFGGAMLVAGLACVIHAFVPAMFTTTGSRTVKRLFDRMVVNRSAATDA
jgi:hypothetical protein